MKENKKRKILLVVAIATVLLTIVGATYAYFTAQEGKATTRDVEATTGTTDALTFKTEGELEINASILNFKEGDKSLRDDAKAIATLKAGTESEPDMNYYVYLQIDKNEFKYTTEAKTPEILLKVTGPNGEVESLPGLGNAITVTIDGKEEKGFDITEQKGLILIADEFNITTTNEKIDEWIIEIVYINLNSNQNDHLDKNLNGKIKIQANKFLYHRDCEDDSLTCKLTKMFTKDGDNGLYYHDGVGTYTNANLEARDNAYRYSGSNPSNYVCLGVDLTEETCPANNLYRIIGLFPVDENATEYQIKLIKNASIGNYIWSGSESNASNDWSKSTLRTDVLNNPNGAYWKSLGSDASKVAEHNWVISGGPKEGMELKANAQTVYNYEVAKECSTCEGKAQWVTLSDKIGILYVSDHLYASAPSYWSNYADSYSKAENWSFSGKTEWTISRVSDNYPYAYRMMSSGGIAHNWSANGRDSNFAVRPVLYLNSDVIFSSGKGISTDPYRIK